ncbi:MAG: winged helix DNA-binding domain-containing protein [Pyrinomonadaceae bacterium]|nr:winged helix DNA-binding domain-containing protein [Pyrinomonadaceae bacterium]
MLEELRRFTVARNFFKPTTLKRALHRMGFVQADPIRAPARAQDLILRHRVRNYRAGDLERRYTTLHIEEDFFVTYGFVTSSLQALMHPRSDSRVPADDVGKPWPPAQKKQEQLLLEFVRACGEVHPREVDEHFSHGTVKNYWGGSSNATTHLLDAMHYRGLLRVVRRENGIRIYAVHLHESAPRGAEPAPGAKPESKQRLAAGRSPRLTSGGRAQAPSDAAELRAQIDPAERRGRIDALVDVAVRIYAPVPGPSLAFFVRRLRFAVPQWRAELTSALRRAKQRLAHARVDGIDWYWPANEDLMGQAPQDKVRLLAPFDPVVRDRDRFELLWGWVYRFEAYTPAPKRKLGYYAMPLLWRDRVIGWANLSVKNGELKFDFGYVASQPPRDRAFKRELEAELNRMRAFLGLDF